MYVADENVIIMPEIKQENMDYAKLIYDLDLQSENLYEKMPLNGGRKRMRLHQLSWEEKLQRKKLRNRIAAQTSRDRKKAKMDFLEESIKQLKEQNTTLIKQVEELKNKNEALMDVNEELQKELTVRNYTCSCYKKSMTDENKKDMSDRVTEVKRQYPLKFALSSKRPAESFDFPQQKGQKAILGRDLTKMTSLSLWKIFLVCLLSQKCWKISRERNSSMTLKNWQQVCWRKLNSVDMKKTLSQHLNRLEQVPRAVREECITDNQMVGPSSTILESSGKSQLIKSNLKMENLSVEDQICFISSEHSYTCGSVAAPSLQPHPAEKFLAIPEIKISEAVCSSDDSQFLTTVKTENDDIEDQSEQHFPGNSLDIPFFPNFCSPKSEASSDLGYESHGSPYESDLSSSFGDLFGDGLPELFPELI